jgi:RNA polymerase sigma-70 factor (ECF subfamily)
LPDDGSRQEFEQIFRAHSDYVWRTLRTLGVHPSHLDDALQETFLVVHQRLGEFRGDAELKTWIYAVTYRVAQNFRRKVHNHFSHAELPTTVPSSSPSPADSVAFDQAAHFVAAFCESLPVERRDVFVLCLLEERSAPEAAALLGVPLNTVYSRLRLARLEFRSALEARDTFVRFAAATGTGTRNPTEQKGAT